MNEKTKKEGYTDQLNQELLGTLGEKASSEQISAAYEKREVHREISTYHKNEYKTCQSVERYCSGREHFKDKKKET